MSALPTLVRRAQQVLDHNRRGAWTCPSSALYAHQWLWDSCFIAVGVARYDPERAAAELRALLRGQWANGMLPHMIFADSSHDAGSRTIWRSRTRAFAPRDVATSCITQPPLLAIATSRVADALPGAQREQLLTDLVAPLVEYHTWLYAARDLGSGLVTLIHPWECGLDTTPPWMQELGRMPLPIWLRVAVRLRLARALRALRYDTRHLPASQRASDDDGLRMLVLAIRAGEHDFELRRMPRDTSVLVEDLAFNSLLIAANRSLERIAAEIGSPVGPELQQSFRRTEAALEALWDEPSGQYYSRNPASGDLIRTPALSTFLPLFARVPSRERAARLVSLLRDPEKYWPAWGVPSVPVDAPGFSETSYWKGPTWVNTNWLIAEGLAAYDESQLAADLRRRTIELVENAGFWEYFSPLSGAGYGAPDFSWTAALVVDLLALTTPAP